MLPRPALALARPLATGSNVSIMTSRLSRGGDGDGVLGPPGVREGAAPLSRAFPHMCSCVCVHTWLCLAPRRVLALGTAAHRGLSPCPQPSCHPHPTQGWPGSQGLSWHGEQLLSHRGSEPRGEQQHGEPHACAGHPTCVPGTRTRGWGCVAPCLALLRVGETGRCCRDTEWVVTQGMRVCTKDTRARGVHKCGMCRARASMQGGAWAAPP